MSIKQLTTDPTEAEFEARIRGAIAQAFPWLGPAAIKHQTKFSVRLGRKSIEIASRPNEARADIILYSGRRPLAVLELKRQGGVLTDGDVEQGLCYAKLVNPVAPLTVVSNGVDTQVFNTLTGQPWAPESPDAQTLDNLFKNISHFAAAQVNEAVSALLGSDSRSWIPAINAVTREQLDEMMGDLNDAQLPFARDFLLPRAATVLCLDYLNQGNRVVVLSGSPLSGKSNVLRDICRHVETDQTAGVLFVEAAHGVGVIQQIADALEKTLEWQLSKQEVRRWLRKRSESSGSKLIVLIDDVSSGDPVVRKEIEDLASRYYSSGLQVVLALHDNAADVLQTSENWLSRSPIGRIAVQVSVESLSDDEFQDAEQAVLGMGMAFAPGAQFAPELREPWILRSLASIAIDSVEDGEDGPPHSLLQLPPLLGVDVIAHARSRFDDPELNRLYQGMATALMLDADDRARDPSLLLSSIHTFMVRRRTLIEAMQPRDVDALIQKGFLRAFRHASGDEMLYVRMPELVASELAHQVGDKLLSVKSDNTTAYLRMVEEYSSVLPMGDLIVAQALLDASRNAPDLITNVMQIIRDQPVQAAPVDGLQAGAIMPNGQYLTIVFEAGNASITINGKTRRLEGVDPSEFGFTYSFVYSWTVLGHLIKYLIVDVGNESAELNEILLQACQAPLPLRKPDLRFLPQQEITTASGKKVSLMLPDQGFLDSVTYSLLPLLSSGREIADAWITQAIATHSIHLLGRISTALKVITHSADSALAQWACETLRTRIYPEQKLWLAGA